MARIIKPKNKPKIIFMIIFMPVQAKISLAVSTISVVDGVLAKYVNIKIIYGS